MKRLFFALWPDADIRKQTHQLQQRFENERLLKTQSDNIHVTLLFLGNVVAEQERLLVRAAAAIQADSVQLCFDALAFWRKPGILCLTASKQPETVLDLVNKLQGLAKASGVVTEERPYKAHITLARKAKCLPELEIKPIYWQSNRFVLAESTQGEQGVIYRVVHSWPLINC